MKHSTVYRCISVILTLASLTGLFGCACAQAPAHTRASEEIEGFISADADAALLSSDLSKSNVNVAATDENGEALFQIVYDIGATLRVKEQCEALAADIYEETGVEVPVVHSMEKQKEYEITVGDIARSETIDVIDGFDLEDTDFVICTVGTRILIYAENDESLVSAVIFFTEQVVTRSALQFFYGIPSDYSFTYHPNDVPVLTLLESKDPRTVEFKLENGPSMYTYVRLSYTGNEGWRIQTKYSEQSEFRDTGASQLLAYTLGDPMCSCCHLHT